MQSSDWVVALVALVVMEPVTALVHRRVMHGVGMGWHRSHHRTRGGSGFEANDLYPVTFAALTIIAMALGASVPALAPLLGVGVGVTVYGLSYVVVHEVVIHRRVRALEPLVDRVADRVPLLDRWRVAHALHHRFGREPFGMLVPVVPHSVRTRARDGDEVAEVAVQS